MGVAQAYEAGFSHGHPVVPRNMGNQGFSDCCGVMNTICIYIYILRIKIYRYMVNIDS